MYSEQRRYQNGKVLTIETQANGIWHLSGVGIRAPSMPGQSRDDARRKADSLAGAEPASDWQRIGDPAVGDTIPCYEDGCAGMMTCASGPDPNFQGTSEA